MSWEGGAGVPGASARVRTDTGRSAHFLENKAVKSRLSQSSLGVRVPVCVLSPFSRVRLFVTPWIVALQAALSMGFSRQGYWSGFSSVAQLCLTLCDPINRSTPGLPVHHQLPEITQTHVHPAISSSVVPFSSCPQSLPASESFPMNQLFT